MLPHCWLLLFMFLKRDISDRRYHSGNVEWEYNKVGIHRGCLLSRAAEPGVLLGSGSVCQKQAGSDSNL